MSGSSHVTSLVIYYLLIFFKKYIQFHLVFFRVWNLCLPLVIGSSSSRRTKWQLRGQSQWAPSCSLLSPAVALASSAPPRPFPLARLATPADRRTKGSRRVANQNMETTTANKTLNMRRNAKKYFHSASWNMQTAKVVQLSLWSCLCLSNGFLTLACGDREYWIFAPLRSFYLESLNVIYTKKA